MKFSFFRSILAILLNKNSEEAFNKLVALELYHQLLIASLIKPFSSRGEKNWQKIVALLPKADPQIVAQLAIYFREQLHYRWTALTLLVKWSDVYQGDRLMGQTTNRIIHQGKDILDLLTCYEADAQATGEKKLHKLSKQIQKGIAAAFCKLTEEQLVNLPRKRTVTLKDALLLTHPKAQNEVQEQLFNRIYSQKLLAPLTWKEDLTKVSRQKFSNTEAKKQAIKENWEKHLLNDQLSYTDLLRNLPTLLKLELSDSSLEKIRTRIMDPAAIAKSRRLPFSFLSECREIETLGHLKSVDKVLDALEAAMVVSGATLANFFPDSSILLVINQSQEMYRTIGKKNKLQYWDIGMVMEKVLKKQSQEVATNFFEGNEAENPYSDRTSESAVAILEDLIAEKKTYDRIFIFSCRQEWEEDEKNGLAMAWKKYKKHIAPQARLYCFDLMNYQGTPLQILPAEVFLIAGWTERIFEVLSAIEREEEMLTTIRTIKID